MARPFPTPAAAELARYAAAALAVGAGLTHFGVAPEHFEEVFEFGLFMVVVGATQVAAGIALLVRPGRELIVATIVGTVLVFVIYAASRTTGLPFGPEPGHPEAVQAIDIVSKTIELALLLLLIYLANRGFPSGSGAPAADDSRAGDGSDGPRTGLHSRFRPTPGLNRHPDRSAVRVALHAAGLRAGHRRDRARGARADPGQPTARQG